MENSELLKKSYSELQDINSNTSNYDQYESRLDDIDNKFERLIDLIENQNNLLDEVIDSIKNVKDKIPSYTTFSEIERQLSDIKNGIEKSNKLLSE